MERAQRLFGAGKPDGPTPDDVAVDLPLEIVLEMLSSWRRREFLRQTHALDQGDGVSVSDLSRAVAASEYGKDDEEVTDKEHNRIVTGFYDPHGSKLDDAGLIDYDRDTGRVYATEQAATTLRRSEWLLILITCL